MTNSNYATKDSFYLCLHSALSLVSQLGPVKSESIKAWSIKSFSLYLFVLTEQNRTEQNRDTRQSGDGTEVLYSCLCTTQALFVTEQENSQN